MGNESFDFADFALLSGPPEVIERLQMVLSDANAMVHEASDLLRQMNLRNQEVEARLAGVESLLNQQSPAELVADCLDQYEEARQAMLGVLISPRENVQAQAEALLDIVATHAWAIRSVHASKFEAEWAKLQSES